MKCWLIFVFWLIPIFLWFGNMMNENYSNTFWESWVDPDKQSKLWPDVLITSPFKHPGLMLEPPCGGVSPWWSCPPPPAAWLLSPPTDGEQDKHSHVCWDFRVDLSDEELRLWACLLNCEAVCSDQRWYQTYQRSEAWWNQYKPDADSSKFSLHLQLVMYQLWKIISFVFVKC